MIIKEWTGLKMSDGTRSATMICPECRMEASLHSHSINKDGKVNDKDFDILRERLKTKFHYICIRGMRRISI